MIEAPELRRTADSAASVQAGKLRFAAADGYCVDIWTRESGKLTVRVYGERAGPLFYTAADVAVALEMARSTIAGWRDGQAAPQAAAG